MVDNYPILRQFFHNYLNEDYDLEYQDTSHAVAAFLADATPESLRNIAHEITQLLASKLTPTELDALIFGELGCAVSFVDDAKQIAPWLGELKRQAITRE